MRTAAAQIREYVFLLRLKLVFERETLPGFRLIDFISLKVEITSINVKLRRCLSLTQVALMVRKLSVS